jgi:hypothetical protein
MTDISVQNKRRFLTYELGLLSLNAALSTRDKNWPVYDNSIKIHQRSKAKDVFRSILGDIENEYKNGGVTDDAHNCFIERVADFLSVELKDHLHKKRFRIGVTQKLVNLHLKYLWTAGLCPEPPHCPIDGIVRDKAKIDYNWTSNDSIDDYKKAIVLLKNVANERSLSVWELEEFRRRDDTLG